MGTKTEEKISAALLADLDFNISEVEVLVETLNSDLFNDDRKKQFIFQSLISDLLVSKTQELRESYNDILKSNEDE